MQRRAMLSKVLRFVVAYLFALAVVCAILRREVSLHPTAGGEVIASVWKEGQLIERVVLASTKATDPRLDRALSATRGDLVFETVVADGPVLAGSETVLAVSFVPGRDGLSATLNGKTVYVTPDDLLSRQLYDKGIHVAAISLVLGLDTDALANLVAERFGTTPGQVFEHASLRRIRVERLTSDDGPRITADTFGRDDVLQFVTSAAHYLARGITNEGRFRYTVDAPSDRDLPGYDWARHAGATFFLAQASGMTHDPVLTSACIRAAALLRGAALSSCGGLPCVGDERVLALGSSALTLLAFSEIVDRGIDPSYRPLVVGLARFLRSQQRPDGEFMHEYDRNAGHPIDVQGLYYSSEATLALARAHAITQDPADLEAAVRGLRHIVGPAWSFFGDKYYFGEEHWTCQAMAVLWQEAPDPKALDFCLRWQEFGRALQQREGDSYFDADGAIGVGPVVTPRLTPVASRGEAAVATLDIGRRSGVSPAELAKLDLQLRRAFALLLRHQFRPGLHHLLKSPSDVYGAMPGSEVDWELRIDFAQHAGSAMVRWLETTDRDANAKR